MENAEKTSIEKRRFYATYYDHLAQQTQTLYIEAENKFKAVILAVALMKMYGGDMYDETMIESIWEYYDPIFETEDDIKERWNRLRGEEWYFDDYKPNVNESGCIYH